MGPEVEANQSCAIGDEVDGIEHCMITMSRKGLFRSTNVILSASIPKGLVNH
jgi:hypothetical protein